MTEFIVSPPYSILILSDPDANGLPNPVERLISQTERCIVIGTLAEMDGPTRVTVGRTTDVALQCPPHHHSTLLMPDGVITIQTAEGHILFERRDCPLRVGISIWVNDATEPDNIVIGFDQ